MVYKHMFLKHHKVRGVLWNTTEEKNVLGWNTADAFIEQARWNSNTAVEIKLERSN